jgi:hypothetical protein
LVLVLVDYSMPPGPMVYPLGQVIITLVTLAFVVRGIGGH